MADGEEALVHVPDSLEDAVVSAEAYLDDEDEEKALKFGTQALEAAREKQNDVQTARSLRVLVAVEVMKGDLESAEAMASKELELFQEVDCEWGEAMMLLSLAEIDVESSQRPGRQKSSKTSCELALDYALEALDLFRELRETQEGAWYMEGCCLLALVTIYQMRKKPKDMKQAANSALAIFRECGDLRSEARALLGLARSHNTVGKHMEASKVGRRALEIFAELGQHRLAANTYLAMANFHASDDDWENALVAAEEALILYSNLTKEDDEIAAMSLMVKAHCRRGTVQTAAEKAEEFLWKMKEKQSKRGETSLLEVMAGVRLAQGAKQEAVDTTEEALENTRSLKDKRWEAKLLYAQAQLLLELQQNAAAWEKAWEAHSFFKENGEDDFATAISLHIIVPLHLANMDEGAGLFEAMNTAAESLAYYRKTGDERGEGIANFIVGVLHSDVGNIDEGDKALKKAQELFQDAEDYKLEANVCRIIADICRQQGKFPEAARLAHEACGLLAKAKDLRSQVSMQMFTAKCHTDISGQLKARHEPEHSLKAENEKALKCAFAGKNLARKIGDNKLLGETLLELGQVALAQGTSKLKDARSAADEALGVFKMNGLPWEEANTQLLLAEVHALSGQKEEGSQACDEAIRIFGEINDWESLAHAQHLKDRIAPPKPSMPDQAEWEAYQAQQEAGYTPEVEEVAYSAAPEQQIVVEEKKALDLEVVKSTISQMMDVLIGDVLDIDTPFMDAGLDSLLSIQFRQELIANFQGLQLSSTITFDYPSARQLAEHVVEKSVEALEG